MFKMTMPEKKPTLDYGRTFSRRTRFVWDAVLTAGVLLPLYVYFVYVTWHIQW